MVRGGAFCDGPWYGYRAEVQRGRGGDGGGARGAREEYTPQFNQDYRYEGEFRRVEGKELLLKFVSDKTQRVSRGRTPASRGRQVATDGVGHAAPGGPVKCPHVEPGAAFNTRRPLLLEWGCTVWKKYYSQPFAAPRNRNLPSRLPLTPPVRARARSQQTSTRSRCVRAAAAHSRRAAPTLTILVGPEYFC